MYKKKWIGNFVAIMFFFQILLELNGRTDISIEIIIKVPVHT